MLWGYDNFINSQSNIRHGRKSKRDNIGLILSLLFYFLFQIAEVVCIKELENGNAQPIAKHFERDNTGIFALAIQNILYG